MSSDSVDEGKRASGGPFYYSGDPDMSGLNSTRGSAARAIAALLFADCGPADIRLYTQSDDEAIKRRCLDAIDRMEEAGFFSLSDELRRLDR